MNKYKMNDQPSQFSEYFFSSFFNVLLTIKKSTYVME